MTDFPIIFAAAMIRALHAGRKNQTRRLAIRRDGRPSLWTRCRPGDRLWVKEVFAPRADAVGFAYRADDEIVSDIRWRSPIHMPRIASRLTLAVTDCRRQRVHEITEADAQCEGVLAANAGAGVGADAGTARKAFRATWESFHRKPGTAWTDDPEVIAIGFTVRLGNIGAPTPGDSDR